MIRPRFAGSALNRAGWWSPTASKSSPHSHSAAPATARAPGRPVAYAAACTGSETSQTRPAWSR